MAKRRNTVPVLTAASLNALPIYKCPKFTDDEKSLVEAFLLRLGHAAACAYKNACEMLSLAPEDPRNPEQVQYWKNALGFVRWATFQAQGRQRQLVAAELQRMVEELAQ